MACSACGFENPATMRFCGMCGTPLPHRPLTAPGAQSTLNLTRVPVDAKGASSYADQSSDRAGVLVENPPAGANGNRDGQVETLRTDNRTEVEPAPEMRPTSILGLDRGPSAAEITQPTPAHEAAVEGTAPPAELVPDVPLQEYVQSFRYEPPKDTAETSMRGEAAIAHADEVVHQDIASGPVSESVTLPTAEVIAVPEKKEPADVEKRLGLEPESREEVGIGRPRFLDVNERVEAPPPTSRISGPSFLGLSDAPPAASDIENVDEPRGSSWRGWFAAAVVLLFVGLGVLEWRAQTKQTDNGPVEVIRSKIRNWRQGSPQPGSTPAAPASADTHAQPEIQVQEQPKPAAPPPTVTSDDPSKANSTATTGAAPQTGQQQAAATPPAQASPATSTQAPPAAAKPIEVTPKPSRDNIAKASTPPPLDTKPSPQVRTETPKPKRPTADAEPTKPAPGAEEMLKAKNASDSAAAAAWLWKATAKGNPDGPVELANMYIAGNGVPRSCEQAMVLLKSAATKENAHARNRLASLYQTGTCVQRNRVEAYRWMSAALDANPNSQWAQQNRDLLWGQMSSEERVMAQKYR